MSGLLGDLIDSSAQAYTGWLALNHALESEVVWALLAARGKGQDLAERKAIIYALARYPQPQVTSVLPPLLKNKISDLDNSPRNTYHLLRLRRHRRPKTRYGHIRDRAITS
jgi:hypothetical protein